MYSPQPFAERRLPVLHELMRAHPLGTLVIATDAGLVANHLPFELEAAEGELGILRAHVSRANPLWRQLSGPLEALIVFQGPQAYVSPSWYPSKHADGKAVPTWNYAVVHAYGRPRPIEDPAWLLKHVTWLTRAHESGQALPWEVSDAPRDYVDHMIERIVGLEVPISKLHGKWKVSQNRPVADRMGVAAGLESRVAGGRERDPSRAMAALVMQRVPPD